MQVVILTRKDKPDEAKLVEQIQQNVAQAAILANKQVQVEVSGDFSKVDQLSVNPATTPIIIVEGATAFAAQVPTVDQMKIILLNASKPNEGF